MHSYLTKLGLPELLEHPERLALLTDEQLDNLADVRDEAADALESNPDDATNIDTVYIAHMTLTSALFLRALSADVQPQAIPPGAVLARSWKGSPLRTASADAVRDVLAPSTTIDVLTKAGLPAAAEPEITFDDAPVRLSSVIEIPEDDQDASADFFAAYWRIGTTSLGDALCIDERADGVVVLLDCEWGFYAQQFVNTSVGHLLLCLEAWRALESDTSDDVDGIIERFASAVERVDPAALTEGAFWSDMLDALDDDDDNDDDEDEEG
jgi:hypothetical protein